MVQALRDRQRAAGAIFNEGITSVPISFGNDEAAHQAVQDGVVLCDRSHWGRLQISGEDRQRFLHNQTTNDFQSRQPGQGCDTVFVTSTGRTLDLVTAYITEEEVLLLTSPGQAEKLIAWMDRYIFFADKVTLTDQTHTTVTFTLLGPKSHGVIEATGAQKILNGSPGCHQQIYWDDLQIRVAVGGGLKLAGYTLWVATNQANQLWKKLLQTGAIPMGERAWEQLRIQQGRPMAGQELTEDYNPLEAGLWNMISFEKGCYIGQETIARLNTYKGVKQTLLGLRLNDMVPPGSPIQVDDRKVGTLTSITETSMGPIGLGYIRTKAGGVGLKVNVEGVPGEVIEPVFPIHEYFS